MFHLAQLGWSPFFEEQVSPQERSRWVPARVAQEARELYRLFAEPGERWGEPAGRLRREGKPLPGVGDWVLADWSVPGNARIERVLNPRSRVSRKAAGRQTRQQILVSNADTLFLVTSADRDFNLRRLERYLAAAWESGAVPVVVLNKSDLAEDLELLRDQIESVAIGVRILTTSALRGEGVGTLRVFLRSGQTAAFLGSSGVGKSTLINTLLGEARQSTAPVRKSDGRGQHQTARRELLLLPEGGIVIDTPGLRELQLWDGEIGSASAFAEVAALAAGCRFRDCRHGDEPDCAVLSALASGALDAERFENYQKLERERRFLESRRDPAARAARLREVKRQMKEHRRDSHRKRGR